MVVAEELGEPVPVEDGGADAAELAEALADALAEAPAAAPAPPPAPLPPAAASSLIANHCENLVIMMDI